MKSDGEERYEVGKSLGSAGATSQMDGLKRTCGSIINAPQKAHKTAPRHSTLRIWGQMGLSDNYSCLFTQTT